MSVNSYIDHTLLKADANEEQIYALIDEAKKYQFASVCVNPTWVKTAAELLKDSSVNVCTVIGFPLGASTSAVKAFEAKDAIANGADEIDMVINIGALKSRNLKLVEDDIKAVVEASGRRLVKVIIETCLLTDEEKVQACQLAKLAGADFVKTSTGFSTGGATIEDIELMRETVGPTMGVKASGGARTLEAAQAFITPLTLQVLSKNPVHTDVMEEKLAERINHIDLAKETDLFIVAPASANTIAKLAHGMADNMLTATALALPSTTPKLIAPAMNTKMYENPLTKKNLETLQEVGYQKILPKSGLLACGDTGRGALADIAVIIDSIDSALTRKGVYDE